MTAFGKHIVTLAGEPSSSLSDRNELSMAYILDTSKIRYPPNESATPQAAMNTPENSAEVSAATSPRPGTGHRRIAKACCQGRSNSELLTCPPALGQVGRVCLVQLVKRLLDLHRYSNRLSQG